MTKFDVLTIGNAIVDIIARCDDAFLVHNGIIKSAMNLIDANRAELLYSRMGPALEASGGSAGNTAAGVASLGGRAAYFGKVANDQLGEIFAHDIRAQGVHFETKPLEKEPPTARSMIFVTEDGERSMNTFLGASTEFAANDVDVRAVASGEWLYLEGYLFDKPAAKTAFVHASEVAKSSGRKVAVTLSDVFCVDRHRASFVHLIRTHCDLVFANEAELLALYETTDFDAAVSQIRNDSQIAAITREGRGYHRDWCARVFAPALDGLTGVTRERRLAQLVAVCDVYTWKLLHRDAGLSRHQVTIGLRELLEPLTSTAPGGG